MDLKKLKTICFYICIACIVLGTVLGLAMIWMDISANEYVQKAWLSIGLLFISSLVTMVVTQTAEGKKKAGED